jgi:hypothetical protein
MASKITRYDLVDLNEGTQEPEAWDMAPAKRGVYVEYEDHMAVVRELKREIAILKGLPTGEDPPASPHMPDGY